MASVEPSFPDSPVEDRAVPAEPTFPQEPAAESSAEHVAGGMETAMRSQIIWSFLREGPLP